MRGRGLKHELVGLNVEDLQVARRARAWIETFGGINIPRNNTVARRARAWIETKTLYAADLNKQSRPPCAGVD